MASTNAVALQISSSHDPAAAERRRRKTAVQNIGTNVLQLDEEDTCVNIAERGFRRREFRPAAATGAAAAASSMDVAGPTGGHVAGEASDDAAAAAARASGNAEADRGDPVPPGTEGGSGGDDAGTATSDAHQFIEGQYTSWLVVGVPASLCDKSGGLLSFKRGDSEEGRAALVLQQIVEFMLAAYFGPVEELMATPEADVSPTQVLHVYLEAVVHQTDNDLPLQYPPRAGTPVLKSVDIRKMYTQQHFASLFTDGNYAGWRLHFVAFDTRLSVPRMLRHRVIRNQVVANIVRNEEVAMTRIILTETPFDATEETIKTRVANGLYQHRRERYLEKHPEERAGDGPNLPALNEREVVNAIHAAESMPSIDDQNNAIVSITRGAGELYTAVLTNKALVELLHTYVRLCGLTTALPSINNERAVPWRNGGPAAELAPHKVFSLENSTRILQRYSPNETISPQQAEPSMYGVGDRTVLVRSAPFPHLVWQLPLGILSPQTFMTYCAPWSNVSPFELACRGYENAIHLSNQMEQHRRTAGGAAAATTTTTDGVSTTHSTAAAAADDDDDVLFTSRMTTRGNLNGYKGLTKNVRRDALTQQLDMRQKNSVREEKEATLRRDMAAANDESSLSVVSALVAGKDILRDAAAMRARGLDPERYLNPRDESTTDAPDTRRFISGITLLSQQNAERNLRIARILSQWPPLHGPESRSTPEARAESNREASACLASALKTTTEREYETLLMRGDSTLSSTYLFVSRNMRNGKLDTVFQPSMVRMKGYTMDSMFYYTFFQDVAMCYNIRREMNVARRVFLNSASDAVRPASFEGTPYITIGPADASKSHMLNAGVRQFPSETTAPLMFGSAKHDLVGGAPQTGTYTAIEEMEHFYADGRQQVQAKNRELIDMEKKKTSQDMMRVSRLQKDELSGDFRQRVVEVETRGAAQRMGNYFFQCPGGDRALSTRNNISYMMPRAENGYNSAARMLNFGRRDSDELRTAFEARRVTLNMVNAIVAGASSAGVLPKFCNTLAAVIEYKACSEMSRWAPEFQLDNRKQRRYHTYVYNNQINAAAYQECSSVVSRYLEWDRADASGKIVGTAPFRIDTLHAVWATHMFCKTSPAVTALYDTVEEYRGMRPWQALYFAASGLCGFDRYLYEPLYNSHGLLPNVQARADEFVEGSDNVGRGRLPSFVTEYDAWVDALTQMARVRNLNNDNGSGMAVAENKTKRFPSFLRYSGTYDAFVMRLTSLLSQYFQIESIQVRSMLDYFRTKTIRIPVIKTLDIDTPVCPASLKFNTTPLQSPMGCNGAVERANNIQWVEKAVISTVRTTTETGARRFSSGGDAESASGALDENGNEVQIAIHYLMVKLHHLYYMGATAWCDPRTLPAKIMVPIPSVLHEEVMHTMEVGPRYHVPNTTTYNPNYKGSGFHQMAMDVDTKSIGDVLGAVDTRSTFERATSTIDPAENTPITSYRYSLELDLWIKFLADNHLSPTDEEMASIKLIEERVEKQVADTIAAADVAALASEGVLDVVAWRAAEAANDAAAMRALLQNRADYAVDDDAMDDDDDDPASGNNDTEEDAVTAGDRNNERALAAAAAAAATVDLDVVRARIDERRVQAASEAMASNDFLVQKCRIPPAIARCWPRMNSFDRWAILHNNGPMRAEIRLECLQERNKMINSTFNTKLDVIDNNEYPAVALNHVECDQNLRSIVDVLMPARGMDACELGDMPQVSAARRQLIVRICASRALPNALSYAEANEYLDYVLPDGEWGRLFASSDDDMLQEKRRADQMRAMIIDMCVATFMNRSKTSDDIVQRRADARHLRNTINTAILQHTPTNATPLMRETWDTAIVMLFLYYRARLEQLIDKTKQRAMVLYNNALAVSVENLQDAKQHVLDNITPLESFLIQQRRVQVDDDTLRIKAPERYSSAYIGGAGRPGRVGGGGGQKRSSDSASAAPKRIAVDETLFLGSTPTDAQIEHAAKQMAKNAAAAAGKQFGPYDADESSNDAPGSLGGEDSLDALSVRRPIGATTFASYRNLFPRTHK